MSDHFYPANVDAGAAPVGQVVYVPVYSHVYLSGKGKRELATTLSVRNTDLKSRIIVTSVRYYDSAGTLVEEHLADNHALAPLATTEFVVEQKDTRGGSGANFIVEWVAEQAVNEPIVEAAMAGVTGTQALSFMRSGKVISTKVGNR